MNNHKNKQQTPSNEALIEIQAPEINHQQTNVIYPEQVPAALFTSGTMITLSTFLIVMAYRKFQVKDIENPSDSADLIALIAIIALLNTYRYLWTQNNYDKQNERLFKNINKINDLMENLYKSVLDVRGTTINSNRIYDSINTFLENSLKHFQLEEIVENIRSKKKTFSTLPDLTNTQKRGTSPTLSDLTHANKLTLLYKIINTDKDKLSVLIRLEIILNQKWQTITSQSEPLFTVIEYFDVKGSLWSIYTVHSHVPALLVNRPLLNEEVAQLDQLINQVKINHYSLTSKKDEKNNTVFCLENITKEITQTPTKKIEPLEKKNKMTRSPEKPKILKNESIELRTEQAHKREDNKNTNLNIKNLPIRKFAPVVYCPLPTQPVQITKQSINDLLYEIKNDDIITETKEENNFNKPTKINRKNALSSCPFLLFNNSNSLNKITENPITVNEDIFLIITCPNEPKKEYQIHYMPGYGNGKKPYFGFLTHKIENEKNVKPKKDHFITALGSSKIGGQIDREVTKEMKKTSHTIRINERSNKMHLVGREFEYDFKIQKTGEEINLIIFDGMYWKRNEWGTGCVTIKDDNLMKGNFRDQSLTLSIEIRLRPCPEITTTIQPTMSLKM